MEDILWKPSEEFMNTSNIFSYIGWMARERGLLFKTYDELWRYSVGDIEAFWKSVWAYFSIGHKGKIERVVSSHRMPIVKWFEGIELNYADVAVSALGSGEVLIFEREDGLKKIISSEELKEHVRAFAGFLLSAGVGRGDRVAAILPNCPEAVVGFLASASIGAIWSSCSADFGVAGIVDRFKQIEPKVLLTVDGYFYAGKKIERLGVAEKVHEALECIKTIVLIPYIGKSRDNYKGGWLGWDEALDKGKGFLTGIEMLPFNHPLWILYSSGTTGLPKPLVHSHGGIVIEHLKTLAFHNDLKKEDRFFWFTSTGWMMWNYLVGGLLLGSKIVLYDGSPSFPSMYRLWELAEKNGVTYFGTSAPYLAFLAKSGIQPKSTYNLKKLRGLGSTGSPLSADLFRWVYKNVKSDVWLGSISGGTDVCTAFVGSCPILPVIAGRIQCRYLGASVDCFDEKGRSLVNHVGELVIKEPMPSMPIYFWNDPDYRKYKDSYFSIYPGVWRHGDWIEIKDDGTCIIFGRSDATIKKKGVRIGTAEIYRIVEAIPEVHEALAVSVDPDFGSEKGDGESILLLFLVMKEGRKLDAKLKEEVKKRISSELSPRYLPDIVIEAPDIPKTLNGKKMEVPVKRLLLGAELKNLINPGSMINPSSLEFYYEFRRRMINYNASEKSHTL